MWYEIVVVDQSMGIVDTGFVDTGFVDMGIDTGVVDTGIAGMGFVDTEIAWTAAGMGTGTVAGKGWSGT